MRILHYEMSFSRLIPRSSIRSLSGNSSSYFGSDRVSKTIEKGRQSTQRVGGADR